MRTQQSSSSPDTSPARVAGYEVLRRLGRGSRADVLLGAAGGRDDEGARRLAALKVINSGATAESVDVEVDLLSRGVSPHVVELIDLSTSRDGTCLVLQPVLSGSSTMTATDAVSTGRAVTLLVSAAYGLERVHEEGFAHGSVRADRVLLDHTGRPVLLGFGHAVRAADLDTRSAFQCALDEDRRAFAAVCRSHLVGSDTSVLAREIERRANSSAPGFFEWVESELFSCADPLPLLANDSQADGPAPSGWDCDRAPEDQLDLASSAGRARTIGFDWDRADREHNEKISAGIQEAGIADPSLELLRTGFAGLGRDLAERVRRVSHRRRRMVGAVAAAGIAAATLFVVLLPGADASSASVGPSTDTRLDTSGETERNATSWAVSQEIEPVVDDPLGALPELLREAQPASGRLDPSRYTEVQLVGDFAVLTADSAQQNQPPPILVENSGDGWRLREMYLSPDG